MPRIFDNIEQKFLRALCDTLAVSQHSDFCIGYFNLRGWRKLDSYVEKWAGGTDNSCRLLIGMQAMPQDELRQAISVVEKDNIIDNQTVIKLKRKLAQEFRDQLVIGVPTDADEAGLRRLAKQIKNKKVIVKLFLKHSLHAKLYLLFRNDPINPIIGYLGSSNLTMAGLSEQGELNIDVLDGDACNKLAKWFEDRWNDRWCIDISEELAKIIDESWAREEIIPPFHIYIKMAYHLSQEAREGLTEFQIPKDFKNKLFKFQEAAVQMAAKKLNVRGGVVIGDVVGLGKTLMASALARIFEDDHDLETLILCPKNLEKMWEDYKDKYRLRAKVLSISRATRELPKLRRYRIVIIDESHNFRNREGIRYRAIREYINENESRCILLSATPYNKNYLDLSNQVRLFVQEDKNLGIKPEKLIRELTETEFRRRHQCSIHSLAAFEKSEYPDDWRELIRLYMVRRTRSFIKENYADFDNETGRKYLTFEDGSRSYFPTRIPKTAKFKIGKGEEADQYSKLYSENIVDIINALNLPRYGLGNYIQPTSSLPPTQDEEKIIRDLSRAGRRLMGFCRTNLFKRLESCGQVFLQSIERHILRNYIYIYAIENGSKLPLGMQGAEFLDTRSNDGDEQLGALSEFVSDDDNEITDIIDEPLEKSLSDFKQRAAEIYTLYDKKYKNRFKWLRGSLFIDQLAKDLEKDAQSLLQILKEYGKWDASKDTKIGALFNIIAKKHPNEKIVVFTQYADTVNYLVEQLKERGVTKIEGATGDSSDPTQIAWRFSPVSNEKREQINPEDELRVLIATDVLSEGQNLQDSYIVVNYDLPWAIIRLVQRAGRVDRIGQKAENILCYSFLPAEGVEQIIHLRSRVRLRLKENREVVGSDEAFFEDDRNDSVVRDLYTEKSGILDDERDTEVDLASLAYQIWKNAITADPELEKIISELPPVVYSTKPHIPAENEPEGALVYLRTAEGNDSLAWVDRDGNSVSESQYTILKTAECEPNTPGLPRLRNHHELVKKGVEMIISEEKQVGGQLGRPSGARFRTYERLKRYAEQNRGTVFDKPELHIAIEDIYKYPLRQAAIDTLNRQLRSGISDEILSELVITLRSEDRLCIISEEERSQEPTIICSMGLVKQ